MIVKILFVYRSLDVNWLCQERLVQLEQYQVQAPHLKALKEEGNYKVLKNTYIVKKVVIYILACLLEVI